MRRCAGPSRRRRLWRRAGSVWNTSRGGRPRPIVRAWMTPGNPAYGLKRPSGKPLRTAAGTVLSWYYTRPLGKDGDDALSREEFVAGHHQGKEKNAEILAQLDANRDGRLDDGEMASLVWTDSLAAFYHYDANQDGAVDDDEMLKGAAWGQSVSRRTVRAFDVDGDGKLSFKEFRATPVVNQVSNWWRPRQDADNDGRISWQEFYIEEPPVLIGVVGRRWRWARSCTG